MSSGLTKVARIHFSMANKGKREIKRGPEPIVDTPDGRVPRISRLMALAIKFDHLLETGAIRDQTEIAELGHVTRARVTQIMNLRHLAPDIQEDVLFLPHVTEGDDPIAEKHLRPVVAQPSWAVQRQLWKSVRRK